jgi:predicted phosphodiesterase
MGGAVHYPGVDEMKGKPKRFIVVSDNHGSHIDAKAQAAFFDFAKAWRADLRIHAGDCFDVAAWRKGASEDERRQSLADDIDAGCDFLSRLRPTHWLRGNHDERLWDALAGDVGDKKDLALAKITGPISKSIGNARVFPYCKRAGVLRLGHLKVIHGYHSGVQAARMAAQVYGSVLMGHVHAIDHYSIPGLERRIGRSIGAMCHLDAQYNRAQTGTLRQQHGWGYGFILGNGEYVYYQAEKNESGWYLPTEFRRIVA